VATLNIIRRWALRDQMSIREISRRTGLARNTIKKHLRSEENEPKYPRRVSSSKLDPYAEKLATWLGIEATKSRKERRTLRQIHTLSPKRRKLRTYPHREHVLLTKSVGQYSMENSGQTSAEFNNAGNCNLHRTLRVANTMPPDTPYGLHGSGEQMGEQVASVRL